ncbi:unnamed protein product [Sphenostylis stenocarpa]|uniref:Uncharacterized protein n=1 Tax=Sphenostylis stenocarpa TaxID=92480 RepID=A0AA86SA63_9FABA|nr:unnamed protein product [Sphenostylis stenocarpa]
MSENQIRSLSLSLSHSHSQTNDLHLRRKPFGKRSIVRVILVYWIFGEFHYAAMQMLAKQLLIKTVL